MIVYGTSRATLVVQINVIVHKNRMKVEEGRIKNREESRENGGRITRWKVV